MLNHIGSFFPFVNEEFIMNALENYAYVKSAIVWRKYISILNQEKPKSSAKFPCYETFKTSR